MKCAVQAWLWDAAGSTWIAQGQGYWKGCAGVGVRDLGVLGTLEKKKMSILVKGILASKCCRLDGAWHGVKEGK